MIEIIMEQNEIERSRVYGLSFVYKCFKEKKNAIFISSLFRLWAVTKCYRLEIRVPETGEIFNLYITSYFGAEMC